MIKAIAVILFSLAVLCLFFKTKKYPANDTDITCTSKIVEVTEDARQDLLLAFHADIANGTGVIRLQGTIVTGVDVKSVINRQVLFNFTHNKDYYILTSREIHSVRGEHVTEALLGTIEPGFFVREKRVLSYHIKPVEKYGYVFSVAGMPHFICRKT